ncbi:TetR/AcrR family transcriptional regulator [Frankia sp. AgB1.9]|uniref:TetR/AcrR family transcriptional regulator n=1 Tax=unclassified Frankia TaxID=2632575 RepID=UPI0027DDD174|nr:MULTISPECIES: TetR/AcrR family transcriptional regulator [unclassified Frankia]MBL7488847.1 TetR/AcrR family transcriptional regulator [Frankia sp. AgW1.1]MBL7546491.1 TetR/AcrR family transcriptional regulator [Frankia sp. AgB1.9]
MAAGAGASSGQRAQRADARRNVEAILDAATRGLRRDPDVSIADIAAEAGVGRVTLYGHFKTRADLVEAVLARTISHANALFDGLDLDGDPVEALASLATSSWQVVEQHRGVLGAVSRELGHERIRDAHDVILARVGDLVARGQAVGAFRADLPGSWLVTVALTLMHAAAQDVDAGRLTAADAGPYLVRTLVSAFTSP